MMCAIYRIVIQGWTREKALREMTRVANFHEIWVNPSRIFRSSTDRIRRRVGQDTEKPWFVFRAERGGKRLSGRVPGADPALTGGNRAAERRGSGSSDAVGFRV